MGPQGGVMCMEKTAAIPEGAWQALENASTGMANDALARCVERDMEEALKRDAPIPEIVAVIAKKKPKP